MIEEKHDQQRQADRTKPNGNARPVLIYLIILFSAAIILLLLAFFMQQRNNEATISGLRDSITSFESLEELIDENRELREQLDEAQAEVDDLQAQLDDTNQLNEQLQSVNQEYADYAGALYTLYTAEIKWLEKDYAGAAALLTDWDPAYLRSVIAQYDAETEENENDVYNLLLQPRLEALASSLADKGYLEEEYSEQIQTGD